MRPAIGPILAPRVSGVVEQSLAGGLHVIVARRPGVPMVELRLGFPLPADLIRKPAATMVLSESILAGTARYDRSGLASAVQRIGGSLAASVAGDWIVVSGSVLAEHLVEMLRIVGEVLAGASYPNPEVSADRDRMAEEVLMALSQPEVVAEEELEQAAVWSTPLRFRAPEPGGIATGAGGKPPQASPRDPRAGPWPCRSRRGRDSQQGTCRSGARP